MFGLSEAAIITLALVGTVLFGHDKIPKFAKSLGKARNEFEKGKEVETEDEE